MYAYDRTVINAGAEGQDPRRLIKLRVEARDKTRAAGKSPADEKSSAGRAGRFDIATVERGMATGRQSRALKNDGHDLSVSEDCVRRGCLRRGVTERKLDTGQRVEKLKIC